jgi:trigger factor
MSSVKTSVTELPESRVRVQAEVPAEDVERSLARAARELGRELRVPGFRKGKVPPPVVIRRLGREAVLDEALRRSIGQWYSDAIDEAGVVPVGQPDLDVGDLPAQGEPLSFSIEIGVRPKAQLGPYKGVEVGRREPEVDEAAVQAELDRLRDRFATLETVERPAEAGDQIVMDYIGRIDGEPFAGGEGRDQLLELGSGQLIPGFEEQLVGAAAGEQRTVEVTFPEDYVEHLAGKPVTFEVKVSEVKTKRLPELDDEFVAESTEFETMAELREDIEKRLREADEHALEHELEHAVLEAVVAGATIEVPEQLVHARAHEMIEQTISSFERRGIDKQTYLRVIGKDEEALAHEAEPGAASGLRREAVLAAVVEAEAIQPSDEELLEAITPAAERSGEEPQKVLEQLRSRGGLDSVRADVAERQALELLVREARTISVEQARERNLPFTPGRGADEQE